MSLDEQAASPAARLARNEEPESVSEEGATTLPKLKKPAAPAAPANTSVLPELPLYDLPITPDLAARLRGQWSFVEYNSDGEHWLLKEPLPDWAARNRELATKINNGDDAALIELVRRDPRYLAFPSVGARIWLWRLQIMSGRLNRPIDPEDRDNPESDGKQQAEGIKLQSAKATAMLEDLARSVAFTGGSGRHEWTNPREVLRRHQWVQERIEDAAKLLAATPDGVIISERTYSEIAKEVRVPEKFLRDLRRAPGQKAKLAIDILANHFGLGAERMRTLLRQVRRRDDFESLLEDD